MCSPAGHTMIGLAIGLWFLRLGWRGGKDLLAKLWSEKGWILLFVFLANAPDIDYLPGLMCGELNRFHHLITHSFCWVFVFSLGVWLIGRGRSESVGWRLFLFVLLAGSSHLLADMMTEDGAAPFGIMIAWPLSDAYRQAPLQVFGMMAKDHLAMIFQWSNFVTMLRELAVTAPLVLTALWITRRAA